MLFGTKLKIKLEHFIDAIKRFTSGDPSKEFPEAVRLIGRWHTPASNSGVAVLEADNSEAAIRWTLKWNDLMDITLEPAVDDELGGGCRKAGFNRSGLKLTEMRLCHQ